MTAPARAAYERPLRRRAMVLENGPLAPGVYFLKTEKPFDFRPGQCAALAADPDGAVRYYSLACGAGEDHLGFLYDIVEGGELTPRLRNLTPGAEVLLSDPFGSFTDDEGESMWIATGTGIAPFLSFARSLSPEVLNRRKSLLYGGRTPERFYFREELAALLGGKMLCCCSTCSGEDSSYYPGRLSAWLSGAARQKRLSPACRYFLCGSSGMVVEVRDILIAAGVPFENILSEIYF